MRGIKGRENRRTAKKAERQLAKRFVALAIEEMEQDFFLAMEELPDDYDYMEDPNFLDRFFYDKLTDQEKIDFEVDAIGDEDLIDWGELAMEREFNIQALLTAEEMQ